MVATVDCHQETIAGHGGSGRFAGALLWLRWGEIRKGIWVDLDVYV